METGGPISVIGERVVELRSALPRGVELVAVSKFHPVEALMQAYGAGQRRFGESRVQELLDKIPQMPADVKWHYIGHLQTNKVRQIVGRCEMIESVDSVRLLDLIDRESERAGVVSRVLLQVHVAQEETKFGLYPEEFLDYFRSRAFESLKATHICGVMGMASNTGDHTRVERDFEQIRSLFDKIATDKELGLLGFDTVSMGMSGDWPLAVKAGSTLVRVGTYIFGERQ